MFVIKMIVKGLNFEWKKFKKLVVNLLLKVAELLSISNISSLRFFFFPFRQVESADA